MQGPQELVVGEPFNFVAKGADADVPSWKIEGPATLSVSTGISCAITAQGAGALHLTVTVGERSVERDSNASAREATSLVPFLGQGYGSVVIGLAVAL